MLPTTCHKTLFNKKFLPPHPSLFQGTLFFERQSAVRAHSQECIQILDKDACVGFAVQLYPANPPACTLVYPSV